MYLVCTIAVTGGMKKSESFPTSKNSPLSLASDPEQTRLDRASSSNSLTGDNISRQETVSGTPKLNPSNSLTGDKRSQEGTIKGTPALDSKQDIGIRILPAYSTDSNGSNLDNSLIRSSTYPTTTQNSSTISSTTVRNSANPTTSNVQSTNSNNPSTVSVSSNYATTAKCTTGLPNKSAFENKVASVPASQDDDDWLTGISGSQGRGRLPPARSTAGRPPPGNIVEDDDSLFSGN